MTQRQTGGSEMGTKWRTEITYEAAQVWVVCRRGRPASAWCPACAERVELVTAEEAAAVAGVSTRAIDRRVEAIRLHFSETGDGRGSGSASTHY